MSHERLEAILGKGDLKACMRFLADLTEKERQALAKDVQALTQPIIDEPYIMRPVPDCPGALTGDANPRLPAAQAAAFWACSFAQIKKMWRRRWYGLPEDNVLFTIFSVRKPIWLDDWAVWACARNLRYWTIIHRLVRAGLCRRPNGGGYTLGMIYFSGPNPYDLLLADPELLREDIWEVFKIPGGTRYSFGARDYLARSALFPETWIDAIVRLCGEGKLPRERLLDASLDALALDFGPAQAGWFSRAHEALKPTLGERADRSTVYLSLLAGQVSPTVTLALKALLLLTRENLVAPSAVLDSVTPALASRHKGTAQTALQLLDQLDKQNPKLRSPIGIALAEALLHSSPDVHKKAIDLLSRAKDAISGELANILKERVEHVAPSQRTRLLALLSAGAATQPAEVETATPALDEKELRRRAAHLNPKWRDRAGVDYALACLDSGQGDIAGLDFDPLEIPRLAADKHIPAIETVDELINMCAYVLEDPDQTTDLERVFDGISRLCTERPEDFESRTGPLRKRARDRMAQMYAAPFFGFGPLVDLCGLLHAWLSGELVLATKVGTYEYDKDVDLFQVDGSRWTSPMHVSRYPTIARFQSQRVLEIARRCLAGQPAPLLAAPTHEGGWIEPIVLAERAVAWQELSLEMDRLDQIQAFLRLAPDGRSDALKTAGKVEGEFGQALRYALGVGEKIGAEASLWIAAARARNPFGEDDHLRKAHPDLGPNTAQAAAYYLTLQPIPGDDSHKRLLMEVKPSWPESVGTEAITVLLTPKQRADSWWHRESRKSAEELHWMMQIWPIHREAWFGVWAQKYADNLDWWEAAWGNRIFLEPLLDPDAPLGQTARLMLVLALAAKEPTESGLATDALIAAIDDGRFDAGRFGETLAFLLPMLKAARLARTLSQAAGITPLHRHLIGRAVQACLRGDPADAPRDLSALLEFLKENLIECGEGIADADARAYLDRLKATGKTAKLVRDLLGLANGPKPANMHQLRLQVLAGRIARAESWCLRAVRQRCS